MKGASLTGPYGSSRRISALPIAELPHFIGYVRLPAAPRPTRGDE
jgi:hypothetical protein